MGYECFTVRSYLHDKLPPPWHPSLRDEGVDGLLLALGLLDLDQSGTKEMLILEYFDKLCTTLKLDLTLDEFQLGMQALSFRFNEVWWFTFIFYKEFYAIMFAFLTLIEVQ